MSETVALALAAGAVLVAIVALFFVRTVLRLLALLVVVVLVVAVAAEVVVPPAVEERIANEVRAEVAEVGDVGVALGPPPVVARVLLWGSVPWLDVDLHRLRRGGLVVDQVEVELQDVELDRQALWERRVQVHDVGRAVVVAEVSEADLAAALGIDLALTPGRVEVRAGGVGVAGDVAVEAGDLVLGPGLRVGLPVEELLSCPLQGEVLHGAVRLTCRMDEVPAGLVAALQRAVSGSA